MTAQRRCHVSIPTAEEFFAEETDGVHGQPFFLLEACDGSRVVGPYTRLQPYYYGVTHSRACVMNIIDKNTKRLEDQSDVNYCNIV